MYVHKDEKYNDFVQSYRYYSFLNSNGSPSSSYIRLKWIYTHVMLETFFYIIRDAINMSKQVKYSHFVLWDYGVKGINVMPNKINPSH